MTKEERLQFAEICSRDCSSLAGHHDAIRLLNAMLYANPKRNERLYRYRSISVYSLEELLFGYIYAGVAARFNDPLDCKPIVDRRELLSLYRGMYPDYEISDTELAGELNEMADRNAKWFREAAHVASLCEDYDNELMWSHYADSHKGFVLGYDIPKDSATEVNQILYPVVYSNTPLSVCKDVAIDVVQNCHAKQTGVPEKPITNNYWSYMTALFKRECWHYEKEWRLVKIYSLNGGDIPEHFRIFQRASVIYYGKDIDTNNEIRLHTYALLNGLQEFKMEYVFEDGEYRLKAMPYTSEFDDQCRDFIKCHHKVLLHNRLVLAEKYLKEEEVKKV